MARTSPVSQLEKIRAARIKLEKEEQRLMSRGHDKALAQIVQIAHSAGLSAADITAALGGKAKGKKVAAKAVGTKAPKAKRATAGKKVAPKYRDPATGDTWTGRGKAPNWIEGKNRSSYAI